MPIWLSFVAAPKKNICIYTYCDCGILLASLSLKKRLPPKKYTPNITESCPQQPRLRVLSQPPPGLTLGPEVLRSQHVSKLLAWS